MGDPSLLGSIVPRLHEQQKLADFAFVILACAKATDENLGAEELELILSQLQKQTAGDITDAQKMVADAASRYRNCPSPAQLLKEVESSAQRLAEALSETERESVITQLIILAEVDGHVDRQEVAFIHAIGETFGIEVNLST